MRTKLLVALIGVAALAGCGGDDPEPAAEETPAAAAEADLGAIKDYLLTHTASLQEHTSRWPPTPRPTTRSPRRPASTTRSCSPTTAKRSRRW